MSRDHSQNHYGPNASFDGYDSDLASAGILIESLRQQLANRELEVQHVLGKVVLVEQQLAAAHAARVSAQASGIRLLDQLAAAKEECNTLRRIHAENITILERKTAPAVAACKLKDELITDACTAIRAITELPK